jgi:hypothetical protein
LRPRDTLVVSILDRFRSLFSAEPPLASALLRAAPGSEIAKAQEMERRFSLAFAAWRSPSRGDLEMLEAYGSNPYLFGPISTIAEAVGLWVPRLYRAKKGQRARDVRTPPRMERQDGLDAMKTAGLLEEVPQHELLDLLAQPMPGITGFEFWELAATYFLILGEDLFVKEGRPTPRAAPRWLNIVPPTQIQRRPDPASASFEIRTFKGVDNVGILDTVWTRRINPADIYTGVGIGAGRVLKDEIATDEAMSSMARSRFKNNMTPDLMIALLPGMQGMPPPGPDVVKQFAKEWEDKHRGTENAGRAHFFGGDFKAQQLGHSLVESQYVDGRRFNRDTGMQATRVPPEKQGVLENANRSTIDAAETLFQSGAVVPLLNRFCAALQAQLVPDFGSDLVLGFTNPVPADKEFTKAVMVAIPQDFKIDETRALVGLPPLENGAGKELNKGPSGVPVAGAPKNNDPNNPAKPADGGKNAAPAPEQ